MEHTFAFTLGAIIGVLGVFTTCFVWGAFIAYKESELDIDAFSTKEDLWPK